MNAVAKGVSLGIIDQSRKKEIEPISGGQQPYVDLMGRRWVRLQRALFALLTAALYAGCTYVGNFPRNVTDSGTDHCTGPNCPSGERS